MKKNERGFTILPQILAPIFFTNEFWHDLVFANFSQNDRSYFGCLFVDNQHMVGQFGIVCPYSVIRDYFQTIYIPFPQTLTTLSLLNTHLWRYFATNHPNCISKLFLSKIMTTNDARITLGTFVDIKSNILFLKTLNVCNISIRHLQHLNI